MQGEKEMIDHDDGDDFWLASLFTPGGLGIILLIIAIVFWIIAASNDADCSKKQCPAPMTPKLMDHQCLCVTEAR
jgi:hypothetical protein